MGLKKLKNLENGASGEYWKIISLLVDRQTKEIAYQIALFKDQAHAVARDPHLNIVKRYEFSLTDQELLGDLAAIGYTKIKAKAVSMVHVIGTSDLIQYDSDLANAEDV